MLSSATPPKIRVPAQKSERAPISIHKRSVFTSKSGDCGARVVERTQGRAKQYMKRQLTTSHHFLNPVRHQRDRRASACLGVLWDSHR